MAGKEPGLRRWGLAGIATVVAIALAAAAAAAASFWFVSLERERDLRDWRARLSLTAESRLAAVNGWIGGNLDALRVVAGSPDARDLVAGLVDPDREARFRGLLDGVARRSGFAVPEGASGVILLDAKGAPVPAGGGMPPLLPEQTRAVEKALAGEAAVSDIHATDKGVAVVAFAVPVPGAEGGAAGAVLGVRAVGPDLSGRLTPPDGELKSAESHLVRGQDSVVAYLTPLADGTPPLKVFMSRGTPGLVDAALLERAGNAEGVNHAGNAEGVNHAGTPVLAASRAVPGTPWVLVHTVGRAEALGPGEARVRSLLIVFLLLDAAATLGVVAVWRHGAVVREAVSQERHRVAAEGFERLIRFMRTVIDIQPTEIMSCNPDNLITFANRPFAERYGVSILEIKNKPLVEVVGPVIGKTLTEANTRVLRNRADENHLYVFEADGAARELSTAHVYIPADSSHRHATLTIFHDVTELNRERARSEGRLNQLVNTLVGIVDRRDPYSSHHSERVCEVSLAIAGEMGLPPSERDTISLASRLMNLGKIVIPPEVLTKVGDLKPEERELLARGFVLSADLLRSVDFGGTVVETIRQIGESLDGSGPLGMRGERLLPSAQVVAAANAFVGMISPRAWRGALEWADVVAGLRSQIGKRLAAPPVEALITVIEQRGGAERWAHYREPPKPAS